MTKLTQFRGAKICPFRVCVRASGEASAEGDLRFKKRQEPYRLKVV